MTAKECLSCMTPNPAHANYCRKCGRRFPENTKPRRSKKCRIEAFSVVPQSNGNFRVEWIAVNADNVTINGQDVTGKSSFTIAVKGHETIILRAENATSFDVQETNVVYDSSTIYKEKIVEKKVISRGAIFFLLLFIMLSALLSYYAYRLEDRNYSGDRYLSDIVGHKTYLLVNGSNEEINVNVPAEGASLMYAVQTDASEYEVLDLPSWCTLEKNGSHFIIKVAKNRQGDRSVYIRVKTCNDEVVMSLEQAQYKPQRLVVNDNKVLDSKISSASGQITYQVSTDADGYEVISSPSWLNVVAIGSESFTISYEENLEHKERVGWFMVKAEGMEVKINLTQAQKSTAQIETVTVEHDVYENDVKGMKIHLKFSVQNMKGFMGRCVAYMYYEDGTPLKDTNGSYRTTDGQCSFGKDFTPTSDRSTFNDFVIFVPLKELEADKGKHNMKFSCTIWDKSSDSSTSIAHSDYYSFILTK